jgi:cell division protein FtsX
MIRHAGEVAARELAACLLRVSLTSEQLVMVMIGCFVVGAVVGGLAAMVFLRRRV